MRLETRSQWATYRSFPRRFMPNLRARGTVWPFLPFVAGWSRGNDCANELIALSTMSPSPYPARHLRPMSRTFFMLLKREFTDFL